MTIYVELVIVQNFLVTFFLLYISAKIFRLRFTKFSIVLASLCGVAFAFMFALVSLPRGADIVLRAASGLFCVLVFLKTKNWREISKCYITFCALTFCFGGLIYALLVAFKLDGSTNMYSAALACSLILLVPFLFVCAKFARKINAHKKVSSFCYDAKIKLCGLTIITRGFYDSGNRLKDKITGKPINIISLSLASKLSLENIEGRYVNFSTIGGGSKIFVFEVSEIEVAKEGKLQVIKNALLGVMQKNFNDSLSYEMLFNSEVF